MEPSTGATRPDHRQHLASLDALRGMLAMVVVLHHATLNDGPTGLFGRGYLSVDIFFLLSGFVLAFRYDAAFAEGLRSGRFLQRRVARLWPVIAAGIAAGALAAWLDGMPAAELAVRLPAQLALVPVFNGADALFPLDGVEWTLLFELVANLVHAALLWRLSMRMLAGWTVAAAALLVATAHHHGQLDVGWTGPTFVFGFVRVAFSYSAGMLLWRWWRRLPPPRERPRWQPALALAAAPAMMLAATGGHGWWVDPVIVVLLAPPLVAWISRLSLPARWRSVAAMLGAASYPLYAAHLPALELGRWIAHSGADAWMVPAMAAAAGAVMLGRQARRPRISVGAQLRG